MVANPFNAKPSVARDEDAATILTDLLLPVMRYRIARWGVDASGAYEFYRARLETGRVFCQYETDLVRSIRTQLPQLDEIHEAGCGWGQFIFLLAWSGYRAAGFEMDERRFDGAQYFHRILADIDDATASRARIYNEFFPPLRRPTSPNSLVVTTNIVISDPQFVEEQVLWSLRRYHYAVVNIDRFCYKRQPEDRPAFLSRVEQIGLKNLGLFYDAGVDGQFYWFERPGHEPQQ